MSSPKNVESFSGGDEGELVFHDLEDEVVGEEQGCKCKHKWVIECHLNCS